MYDALNSQKISANFHWNPNSKYLNDMIQLNARFYNNLDLLNSNNANNNNNKNNGNLFTSMFTLDGKHLLNNDYETCLYEYTQKNLNKLSKVCIHTNQVLSFYFSSNLI